MSQPYQTEEISPVAPASDWVLPSHVVPLITEIEIKRRTAQLARQIIGKMQGDTIVVVAILKGSFMFASDLLRRFYDCGLSPQIDFIRAASYGYGDISTGKISLQLDVSLDLAGAHVLLVDDIADTGTTLNHLVKHIKRKGAANVETCVLLDKPSRRQVPFKPDYVGFEIPDTFVVGYGLDYAEKYRNVPFIVSLERVLE